MEKTKNREVSLREQIGIDRTVIKEVKVLAVDFEKLIELPNVEIQTDGELFWSLDDGNCFSKLTINDNRMFGKFFAGWKKCFGGYISLGMMSLSINNKETGNLNNLSMEEYLKKLDEISNYLRNKYGVTVDITDAEFKLLEINCTFRINEAFHRYHRSLGLMMYNLPDTYQKIMEVKKKNKDDTSIESETFYRGNNNMEVKIYDKKRHLLDNHICDVGEDIMRIEIILKRRSKVVEVFKTAKLREITDEMICDYYIKQFWKLFQERYMKWRKENGKLLAAMIISHKDISARNWQRNLLNECRNHEQKNRVPIILELEDLLEQLRKMEKNGHFSRVKRELLCKCENDDVFLQGDSRKIEEIIGTVNRIYEERGNGAINLTEPICGENT